MENLSRKEIALLSFRWGEADEEGKAKLYREWPEYRVVFVNLPCDCLFLFKKLDGSFWPELVKLDDNILAACQDPKLSARVLEKLPSETAVKAFCQIYDHPVRFKIIDNITQKSKEKVDQALAEYSIRLLKETRKSPQEENYFMVTKGFLRTLEQSAQTCSGEGCQKPHIEYAPFAMASCLRHSFHLACGPIDHNCTLEKE